MTVLHVDGVARTASQHHQIQHLFHCAVEIFVYPAFDRRGEIAQMHRNGRVRKEVCGDVAIDAFRHKGHKGSGNFDKRVQHRVQRHIGRYLVLRPFATPIAFSATPHIPIGQHVGKRFDSARRFRYFVVLQPRVHSFDKLVHLGEYPFVHERQLAIFQTVFARIEVVDIGVENVKRVGVPQRTQKFALRFADGFVVKPTGKPQSGGSVEVPTHRVCALFVKTVPRIHHVALVLGHFYSVFVPNKPQHNTVFEGRLAKQQCGNCYQSVKPTARLIHRFADEIGGEVLLEKFLVFKRVVKLRIGH